jgi:uncharacterized OB-fold protein
MGVLPDDWTLPALTPRNAEWFTSGALKVQQCSECGALQHPPEELCHHCGSFDLGFKELAGRGTVYSYTVAHYAVNRALVDAVPYAVVLVSLDEAPEVRIIGNVLDIPPDQVRIGMPVEAVWEEREVDGDQLLVPQWVPR